MPMEQPDRCNLERRSFADNEFLIRTIQVAINACTSPETGSRVFDYAILESRGTEARSTARNAAS